MIKNLLLDLLDFMRKQVADDKCTLEQMNSIHNALVKEIKVDATIGDIARHYGQSDANVRNVIARSYVGKPKRRVHYNLIEFVRHMPNNWTRNTQVADEE